MANQNFSNNNQSIRTFLKYYCDLPKEPCYAVLLTGLWGSGKTWFIKDFISEHLTQSKQSLYLSLYGIQNLDDIESALFNLMNPILGSKPVRTLHRLLKGVLKTSINFDIDGDGKSDGNISAGLPTDKFLEKISLNQNSILIFDDLERCSIPMPDLLGYINQFVEHGGMKVILIANEDELPLNESNRGASYARIKEKLIGRTFKVESENALALNHFSNDLLNEAAKYVVQSNLDRISLVCASSGKDNLRILRHALLDFDRLLFAVEKDLLKIEPLITDLLSLFLVYSFEVNSGDITADEIEKIQDTLSGLLKQKNDDAHPDQKYINIREKYAGLNLDLSLIDAAIWTAIFTTGAIPEIDLNKSLKNSKHNQNESQPNWVKLWHCTYLSDDEFPEVLAQVESEWLSWSYKEAGEVIHVTGLLLSFSKDGIYEKTSAEILDFSKKYIDQLIEIGDVPLLKPNFRESRYWRDAHDGLGYHSKDEKKFIEFLEYFDEKRLQKMNSSFSSQAVELLHLMVTNQELFYRRLVLNNNADNIFYRTPILHLIDSIQFVETLLSTDLHKRDIIFYMFKERYSFAQFNVDLQPELAWLQEVAVLLRSEISKRRGKISSVSIKQLLEHYLDPAITSMSAAKLNTSGLIEEQANLA